MKTPKEVSTTYYDNFGNVVLPPDETRYYPNMSLRDYFAGQALAGKTVSGSIIPEMTAKNCYNIADAMLKAREDD